MKPIKILTSKECDNRIKELKNELYKVQKQEYSFEYLEEYYLKCLNKKQENKSFLANIIAGETFNALGPNKKVVFMYSGGEEEKNILNKMYKHSTFSILWKSYDDFRRNTNHSIDNSFGDSKEFKKPNTYLEDFRVENLEYEDDSYYAKEYEFSDIGKHIAKHFWLLSRKYDDETLEYLREIFK